MKHCQITDHSKMGSYPTIKESNLWQKYEKHLFIVKLLKYSNIFTFNQFPIAKRKCKSITKYKNKYITRVFLAICI